jgi:hypothetical protein
MVLEKKIVRVHNFLDHFIAEEENGERESKRMKTV